MTNAKTEGYAPIEQYERHGNFAPCMDVYALAATLYCLLTTEVPFPADCSSWRGASQFCKNVFVIAFA
jgi:serine/threonine protein kinase